MVICRHSHFYGDLQNMAASPASSPFLPQCSSGFIGFRSALALGPDLLCFLTLTSTPPCQSSLPCHELFLLSPALSSIWWNWLPLTHLWVPGHTPPFSWPWLMAMNLLMPMWPWPLLILFSLKAVTLLVDPSMSIPPQTRHSYWYEFLSSSTDLLRSLLHISKAKQIRMGQPIKHLHASSVPALHPAPRWWQWTRQTQTRSPEVFWASAQGIKIGSTVHQPSSPECESFIHPCILRTSCSAWHITELNEYPADEMNDSPSRCIGPNSSLSPCNMGSS